MAESNEPRDCVLSPKRKSEGLEKRCVKMFAPGRPFDHGHKVARDSVERTGVELDVQFPLGESDEDVETDAAVETDAHTVAGVALTAGAVGIAVAISGTSSASVGNVAGGTLLAGGASQRIVDKMDRLVVEGAVGGQSPDDSENTTPDGSVRSTPSPDMQVRSVIKDKLHQLFKFNHDTSLDIHTSLRTQVLKIVNTLKESALQGLSDAYLDKVCKFHPRIFKDTKSTILAIDQCIEYQNLIRFKFQSPTDILEYLEVVEDKMYEHKRPLSAKLVQVVNHLLILYRDVETCEVLIPVWLIYTTIFRIVYHSDSALFHDDVPLTDEEFEDCIATFYEPSDETANPYFADIENRPTSPVFDPTMA